MYLEKYQRVVKNGDENNFYKIMRFLDGGRVSLKNLSTNELIIADATDLISAEIDEDINLYGSPDSIALDRVCISLNFLSFKKAKEQVNDIFRLLFNESIYFPGIDKFVIVSDDLKKYSKMLKAEVKVLTKEHDYIKIKNMDDPAEYFLNKKKVIDEEDNADNITVGELESDLNKINNLKLVLRLFSYSIKFVIRAYYIQLYFELMKDKEDNIKNDD